MWNEMVKDEEITFNGEESAHPGMTLNRIQNCVSDRFTHCCHLFMITWHIYTHCLRIMCEPETKAMS